MVHRMVDNVVDGIANGASGFVNSTANAVKGVGKSLMTGLDGPFQELTGRQGPHRAIDRAADAVVDSGVNFLNQGVIGSARTLGKGVMSALDQPIEQLEGGMKGMGMGLGGRFKLPFGGKK
jgi:phage-related protein